VELFTKINDLQIISARITGHLLVVKIQFITINEWYRVRVMVFNATFNNISGLLWRSVLLLEEAGVPRENH
jgi:hypothetical protein